MPTEGPSSGVPSSGVPSSGVPGPGIAGASSVFDARLRARLSANLEAFERRSITPGDRKPAAVAVTLLAGEGDRPCFALTRRAAGLRAHSGQWALPGGRVDEGESAVEAACRELDEELGVPRSAVEVLGVLDDYATRSGYVMTPVVLWADPAVALTTNPDEVQFVHRVPLAELERDDAPRIVELSESEAPVLQMPIFDFVISPPTAAIVYQFREVAVHGRRTRVARYDQPGFAWQ